MIELRAALRILQGGLFLADLPTDLSHAETRAVFGGDESPVYVDKTRRCGFPGAEVLLVDCNG